jgi:hypothetical protein
MRKAVLAVLAAITLLTITTRAMAQSSSVTYSTVDRGGAVFETAGGPDTLVVGYGRVQPSAGTTTPSGVAIFGLRQNGVLVTEAGVPGMTTMSSGRTYAEVNGIINTGVAFANTSSSPVVVTYSFTDQSGNNSVQNSFTLSGNAQMAKFLSESPFSVGNGFAGTFTFNDSAPVAVIALRTIANERSEFLVTTQIVTALPDTASAGALVMGHFADGGGWKTQVILVNTADFAVSGTVQFYGEGTATVAASPITLTVNGQVAASFSYTIQAKASVNLQTSGPVGVAAQVGSVRITPAAGSTTPSAFTVFSFTSNGVLVSQSTVPAQQPGIAFRTYVEVNSTTGVPGAIQSAIAVTNNSSTSATVNFELTNLAGLNSGLTANVVVPPFGHLSKFVHELFPTLGLPFRGILRASSGNSIAIVSLRSRYNERGDFLITTTPASNEASASSSSELVFPHLVDRGGYTTQFILFSGVPGQTSNGTLRFFAQDGSALNLTVR